MQFNIISGVDQVALQKDDHSHFHKQQNFQKCSVTYLPHDRDVAHLGDVVAGDAGQDQSGHPVGIGHRSVAGLVAVHRLVRVTSLCERAIEEKPENKRLEQKKRGEE